MNLDTCILLTRIVRSTITASEKRRRCWGFVGYLCVNVKSGGCTRENSHVIQNDGGRAMLVIVAR